MCWLHVADWEFRHLLRIWRPALFTRAQSDVILAEMVPGQGTLAWIWACPGKKALNELSGNMAEITREKVQLRWCRIIPD